MRSVNSLNNPTFLDRKTGAYCYVHLTDDKALTFLALHSYTQKLEAELYLKAKLSLLKKHKE
jgi:hypothetical protein